MSETANETPPAPGLDAKRDRLREILKAIGSAAVAFSGGADSTYLLAEARDVLGRENVLAVTLSGSLFPPEDLHQANALAAAGERGLAAVLDGSNADDARVHRPGTRALEELGVRSPLREAGLGKADVRALSRLLGLPTADRPATPCLATRFPYGQAITEAALQRVAAAERHLRQLGYAGCRVRDHGDVARIEVPRDQVARLVSRHHEQIAADLKALGYAYVTVDLQGYRAGSMDEVLENADRAAGKAD